MEAVDQIVHYPDPDCSELKLALAKHLLIDPSSLLLGNGAVDVLDHWLRLSRPNRALLFEPCFGQYHRALRAVNAEIISVQLNPEEGFRIDAKHLESVLAGTFCDLVILCSPHNPTGWALEREEILEIVHVAQRYGTKLLVDESFLDFMPQGRSFSLCQRAHDSENLAVLYSLTKFFALPGLRLGALVTSSDNVRSMEELRDPWSVNHLAQVAGKAALSDEEYKCATVEYIARERIFLTEHLSQISSVKVFGSKVNFILLDIRETCMDSSQWVKTLADYGILVRDCASFTGMGRNYLRVAVKTRKASCRFLEVFSKHVRGK